MDVKLFYNEFITKWYSGDTACPFVQKCRTILVEEAEFFEMAVKFMRSYAKPYEAYTTVCDDMFADGIMNMGRLCSLFAFSIVLSKTFPDIQELLVDQLKKRRGAIEELEKW